MPEPTNDAEHVACTINHLRAAIDQLNEAEFDMEPVNAELAGSIGDARSALYGLITDCEVWLNAVIA